MRFTVIFIITFLSFSQAMAAERITEADLPEAVLFDIRDTENACLLESLKGKQITEQRPIKSDLNRVIKRADLNHDGLTDFIIFTYSIYCELGAAFMWGNGGIPVGIYVGTPDGNASYAFDKTVWSVYIEQEGNKSVVWVGVGGGYCGQKHFKSRADAIRCDRKLLWDSNTQQFEFAPLEQARFYE